MHDGHITKADQKFIDERRGGRNVEMPEETDILGLCGQIIGQRLIEGCSSQNGSSQNGSCI